MLDASLVKTWRAATLAVISIVIIGCTQIKVEESGAAQEPTSLPVKTIEHTSEQIAR